jgi:hypothetical protein
VTDKREQLLDLAQQLIEIATQEAEEVVEQLVADLLQATGVEGHLIFFEEHEPQPEVTEQQIADVLSEMTETGLLEWSGMSEAGEPMFRLNKPEEEESNEETNPDED